MLAPRAYQLRPLAARKPVAVPTAAPPDVAGLLVWFKDGSFYQDTGTATPAVADADPIGAQLDYSGNGRSAVQGTAGKRPTLKLATQNGRNTVLYDGTDDGLVTASVAHGIGTGDFWIMAVLKIGVSASFKSAFSVGANAPAFYLSGLKIVFWIGGAGKTFNTSLTAGSWYVLEVVRASGILLAYINGVQEVTTFANSTSIATAALVLGNDTPTPGGDAYNSHIGELAFWNHTPTLAERQAQVNAAGARWAIAVTP